MPNYQPKVADARINGQCNISDGLPKYLATSMEAQFSEADTDASMSQASDSKPCSRECTDNEDNEQQARMLDEQAEELPARTTSQATKQLEVELVVKRIASRRASVDELQLRVSEIEAECSVARELEAYQKLLLSVDAMRKLARNSAEDLLEDMLALDKLSGLASDDRASRKAAIAQVEAMLDVTDEAKSKLSSLHSKLEEKSKMLTKESKDECVGANMAGCTSPEKQTPASSAMSAPPADRQSSLQQQNISQTPPDIVAPENDFWQTVPLRLRFRAQEEADGYVVVASAKNMNLEDLQLEVSEDGRHLLIRGICLPTPDEATELQTRVRFRFLQSTRFCPCDEDGAGEFIRGLYAEEGRGSFGAFSERFQIPGDADVHCIKASCYGELLRVVLPKMQRRLRSGLGQIHPMMSRTSRRCAQNPFHAGLFGDMW